MLLLLVQFDGRLFIIKSYDLRLLLLLLFSLFLFSSSLRAIFCFAVQLFFFSPVYCEDVPKWIVGSALLSPARSIWWSTLINIYSLIFVRVFWMKQIQRTRAPSLAIHHILEWREYFVLHLFFHTIIIIILPFENWNATIDHLLEWSISEQNVFHVHKFIIRMMNNTCSTDNVLRHKTTTTTTTKTK